MKFRPAVFHWLPVRSFSVLLVLLAGSCGLTEGPSESNTAEKRGFRVGVTYWAPGPEAESCLKGLRAGLAESGFIEGRNLELQLSHAQGEMMNIPSMLQNYDGQQLDAIVTMTTPLLTAACNTVKKTPVVFTCVFDPFVTGVGQSATDHLPGFTGVGSFPPLEKTLLLVEQVIPDVRSIGILYNNAEANSTKVVSVIRQLVTGRGMAFEEVIVANSGEVFQAAQALASRDIQAIWISGDNTALLGFDAIARAASDFDLPLFTNDEDYIGRGALLSAGIGWSASAHASGKLLARVLLGERPRNLPIEEVAVETMALNFDSVRRLGISFPSEVVERADTFVNLWAKSDRPARIALIHTSDRPDKTSEYLRRALGEIGLEHSLDFTLVEYENAASQAPPEAVLAAIASFSPDVVVAASGDGIGKLKRAMLAVTVLVATELDSKPGEETFPPKKLHQTALRIARTLATVK